ncbi:hypothetical protein PF003_g34732 [Phytophthora fragariae]|nr:hypothetical protein PF003_g34732 [Phytophthora fragariae]
MYYNQRNVRNGSEFRPGQLVWLYRPARGPGITKFGHRWRGPGKIIEATGYDNYLIQMLESGQVLVTHCSFLLSYYYLKHLLEQMAKDIAADLREEAVAAADLDSDDEDGAETEMETQGSDQNSPEAVGAAVVTSVATEPSHAATPRAATPARAEIAAAVDEAAAAAPTEQPEANLTPRPDVQQPARRLSPAREQRRRAERPEPAAAATDQDQGRDAVPDRPRVRTKRPEQPQQAPATPLPDGPVPRSERRHTQASGATVDETRAPAELMPDLRHLQQLTSPAMKAKQAAESQLNATEMKTRVAEASDESSSLMSSSPVDPALKKTKKKDPVSPNTEPKDSKLIKTLLQRAMKRPLQHSSPEKPAVKLVKPDVRAVNSQRLQSPQPTKATKQNGSTYLPGVAGEAPTASWPNNRDWHASSPEKPWWNTAAEGTAHVPGVTCWNSKYSV